MPLTANEIIKTLQKDPQREVRIGGDSGPVTKIIDAHFEEKPKKGRKMVMRKLWILVTV